ncbi:DUF2306 domain-containing protein [Nonomuraea sp. JJY05]|jgi:uncharacterized membrane protein|uniref:DUF2306 domain-containing protein n=1 Tax=Nonomuraea sp. JJY05 TaxID=3350255 RepID=UPI00373DF09B
MTHMKAGRLIPAGLLVLSAVPVIAGAVRVAELTGGAAITPDNARFVAAPAPVLLHIAGVTVYTVLGAFQFAPGFRRRRPAWHRAAGRVLVPSGLVAALAGLWMTLFSDLPAGDAGLLTVFRLAAGSAMAGSLALGLAAILRRDVARHRAWMIRAYALGMGAGTQAVLLSAWYAATGGDAHPLARALLHGAAWGLNLAVAEWVIRRRARITAA